MGGGGGKIKYLQNTGNASSPSFQEVTGAGNPFNGVDVGGRAAPWCGDMDEDGDKDCFVGSDDGKVEYFRNTGTASSPTFQEVTGAGNPLESIQVNLGFDVSPWCGDMDNDGDKDCIIGNGGGLLHFFLNTGHASRPVFQEVTGAGNPFDGFDVSGRAAPWCGDMDGDGEVRCYVGAYLQSIQYFKKSASSPVLQEVTGAGNPFDAVNVGGKHHRGVVVWMMMETRTAFWGITMAMSYTFKT